MAAQPLRCTMVLRYLLIVPLLAALGSCSALHSPAMEPAGSPRVRTLKLASWNLEFLAEHDGAGCQPRQPADYQAMRAVADELNADVIAFQEAENVAAARRVFDPARYTVIMESRAGDATGTCGGRHPEQRFIRQAVGFAIRKGIVFDRHPDVTTLMLGNPQLRSGVDVTIRPAAGTPIRLLGVHLKSGCFSGSAASACPTLLGQIPALEAWIDAAAASSTRFAVLGDWNRRLAQSGDGVWLELDDAEPANADLRLADEGTPPKCDERYADFIDHIVLDRRAGSDMLAFREIRYPAGIRHLSDHCPVAVELSR